jgi:hypothetical protein
VGTTLLRVWASDESVHRSMPRDERTDGWLTRRACMGLFQDTGNDKLARWPIMATSQQPSQAKSNGHASCQCWRVTTQLGAQLEPDRRQRARRGCLQSACLRFQTCSRFTALGPYLPEASAWWEARSSIVRSDHNNNTSIQIQRVFDPFTKVYEASYGVFGY